MSKEKYRAGYGVAISFRATAAMVTFLMLWVGVLPAANAYLDPGTGSFVIQTLLAALFSALFVLKSYWARIKGWLTGSKTGPIEEVKPRAGSEKAESKPGSNEDVSDQPGR